MSIIVYQCSVCNRKTELLEKKRSFERVDRCTITNLCKGKLYKIGSKPEHVTGKVPASVTGIEDWVQRKIFFEYTQRLAASTWTVIHDLNTNPSVQVYTANVGSTVYTEADPDSYAIEFVDSNTIRVVFQTTNVGIVHCIARSSNNKKAVPVSASAAVQYAQITSTYARPFSSDMGDLVIGIKDPLISGGANANVDNSLRVQASFTSTTNVVTTNMYKLIDGQTPNSTWITASKVRVGSKVYSLRSLSLTNPVSLETSNGVITEAAKFYLEGYKFKVIGQVSVSKTISLEGLQTWKFKPGYKFNLIDSTTGVVSSYTTASVNVVTDFDAVHPVRTDIIVSETVYDNPLEFMFTIPFENDDIVILYANKPYQPSDKNLKQVINLSALSKADSQANIFVAGKELVANAKILTTIYPEIKILD